MKFNYSVAIDINCLFTTTVKNSQTTLTREHVKNFEWRQGAEWNLGIINDIYKVYVIIQCSQDAKNIIEKLVERKFKGKFDGINEHFDFPTYEIKILCVKNAEQKCEVMQDLEIYTLVDSNWNLLEWCIADGLYCKYFGKTDENTDLTIDNYENLWKEISTFLVTSSKYNGHIHYSNVKQRKLFNDDIHSIIDFPALK